MTTTKAPARPAPSPTVPVTVEVPTSVPLSRVQAIVASLGLPTTDLREFTIGPRGVWIEVFAHDAKGSRYFDQTSGEVAVHRIAIPLDRTK